jgi:hypothetical protein
MKIFRRVVGMTAPPVYRAPLLVQNPHCRQGAPSFMKRQHTPLKPSTASQPGSHVIGHNNQVSEVPTKPDVSWHIYFN